MSFVMELVSESSDVIPTEIFENLTSFLFYRYFPTEDEAQKFCHLVGMVPHPDLTNFIPPCPRCGGAMEKKADSSEKFGYIYRCEKINQGKNEQMNWRLYLESQLHRRDLLCPKYIFLKELCSQLKRYNIVALALYFR
ncbi:uncharacterized protein LOC111621980 [Centruroides sculpturatus]|uniref:uncharacterized protein LOC111621980 n=1 Tax=Centruroides sculpturatus TaxID=218467 RepID=UPI000C6EE6F8|nr:uncharacterized protein LOC111621980 [Centruroides sculpturatus]